MNLEQKFLSFLSKSDLISENDSVLVAFSGGKDSVCLLILLDRFKEKLKIRLGACHIHHGIRKDEAEQDLLFCKDFCQKRNIPFYEKRVDVPAFCKKESLGIEEGARILRYKALEAIAEEEGFNKIATAHSASDQGETVLFRLIRGSGFCGAAGIPQRRGKIIRPLLSFTTDEILEFLNENHMSFKKDSTNDDIFFARNRIRNRILPEMKEISQGAEESFARFGKVSLWQSKLNETLCDKWEKAYHITYENRALPLSALSVLTDDEAGYPILYIALKRFLKKENIVISFERFMSILSLLKSAIEGKIIEIPLAFCFRIEKGFLLLEKNEKKEDSINYQVELNTGITPIPQIGVILKRSDKMPGKVENINKNHLIIHLASDKIEGTLFARNRLDGDTIKIDGFTRSLKKLFQDAKIPAAHRQKIPMICDEKGIVWIPYVGLCDRVRQTNQNEIITLSLELKNTNE